MWRQRGSFIRRNKKIREKIRGFLTRINIHRPDPDLRDILLLSSRRSGTTWLMECLAAEKNLRFVNEPFGGKFRWRVPLMLEDPLKSCIIKDTVLPGEEDLGEVLEELIEDYHQTRICGPYDVFSPNFKLFSNRRVFKIIHGSPLSPYWKTMGEKVEMILMVRHPVATCLSRKREYATPTLDHFLESESYCRRYLNDEMSEIVRNVPDDRYLKFLVEWCLEHRPYKVEMEDAKGCYWLAYEHLRVDPEGGLRKLSEVVELKGLDKMLGRVAVPSASTHPDRHKLVSQGGGGSQFGDKLSPEELAETERILTAFGIDWYDLSQLNPVSGPF